MVYPANVAPAANGMGESYRRGCRGGLAFTGRVNNQEMPGIADILEWARRQVASRVPKADLDQRDPDYIREQLPGLWLLASLYFRAEVRGLERIPNEEPVLMVGNHSGGNL